MQSSPAGAGRAEQFLARIRKEADHARTGQPASIIAKVNSLIDPAVIDELYMASQAGVQIELLVRGMCSLRPGLPGISERIRVLSIVDRYLEHARIFYFQNGGEPIFLLASADWMQRNFDQRVEIAFPILDPVLCTRMGVIYARQPMAAALCDLKIDYTNWPPPQPRRPSAQQPSSINHELIIIDLEDRRSVTYLVEDH
ncbi:MAG: hypothetical protein E6J73_19060 [Deltaproteobacteria bacterium]|nr:MAG: hypothetical protein E6J73_19060 [Deltaproteobacteria bacterium]